MPRLKLILAYDGTNFNGWQIQAGSTQRTVQGSLEKALSKICNQHIRAHGSGRTDTGVHALGQVVHADIPDNRVDAPWQRALNALLPADISVLHASLAPQDFHVRFDALSKTYTYSLWPENRYDIPQRRNFVWATGALDLEAMDRAARLMVGQYDCKCFQNTGTPVDNTVRTVTLVAREPGQFPGEVCYRFEADGFLKQMVRNMVGLLVWIGRGRFSPEDVPTIIAGQDRTVAFPTAPPQGLTLVAVHYPA
ncbi:tRNA pseudouridine(38-40) synthase TruA [Desulfovibrio ferrophilus]|uniref:tRNA pseudouridine synthase A n=1 Tax=Desulfovibrio ferrophilus TaxID=241368 RepID=A0A2Z6B289_9BACT|nr:tRNA pseudouridine(38-40) synthase TruA [Desulfovibrio ferrophilus]BBD09622.1 tRNA pseudouridine synthase A [Desulfovibrio ferrophilus]